MPAENEDHKRHLKTGTFLPHEELLTYEELLHVVKIAVSMGMNKIRLTGGEPLVRKGVISFIEKLAKIEGLDQIRLTTNGVLLPDYAEPLFQAGVRHINVSLDTLQKDKFTKITGRDSFDKVWAGLNKAQKLGFKIKLNIVAMKGVNDDEFQDFGKLALDNPFQVRFIEFMPVGEENSWQKKQFVGTDEIKESISRLGALQPFQKSHGEGPARMYSLETDAGQKGSVGFISPISHHFCDKCNRLRLTSEGKLRACLLLDNETDLKHLIRHGATEQEIAEQIRQTIMNKPQGHKLHEELAANDDKQCSGRMSRIGG